MEEEMDQGAIQDGDSAVWRLTCHGKGGKGTETEAEVSEFRLPGQRP